MLGRDEQDPLFLQMKEAEASVLEEFLGPSEFENHGERVVTGQRLMQASSDIFLGWLHVEAGIDGKPRDFYGRQLKDWKGSAEVERMVPRRHGRLRARCAAGRSRAPTPAAATASRSPPISARAPSFDRAHRRVLARLRRAERARLQGPRDGGRPGRRRADPGSGTRRAQARAPAPAAAAGARSRAARAWPAAYSSSLIAPRSRSAARRSSLAALEEPPPVSRAPERRARGRLSRPATWAYSRIAARIDTGSASGNSSAIWPREHVARRRSARIVNSSIVHGLRVAGIGPQMNTSASSPAVIQ